MTSCWILNALSQNATAIGALKDVALGGSAVATAIIALRGVRAWKRELHGRAEYEVAKGLALETFRFRDAIKIARAPFVSLVADVPESQAWREALNLRFSGVQEALSTFDTRALEAEALWGEAVATKTKRLHQIAQTLWAAHDSYLRNVEGDGEDFKADRAYALDVRGKVFSAGLRGTDEFGNEIQLAIADIVSFVKPILHKP